METDVTQPKRMPYWGLDRRTEDRPGVPRESKPHPLPGAHWTVPEQQVPTTEVLVRADLDKLTPVFGTKQPPHGLSGVLRRMAYRVPDWHVRHWLILMLADRVDALESRFTRARLFWPLTAAGAAIAVVVAIRASRRRNR
jgi:hypothetical protein